MIDAHTEIDFKTASSWWPEISNKWTPVAWRDHRFRFNVLWNGSVMVIPWPTGTQRAEDLKNEPSFHLNIIPARDEELPGEWAVAMGCRRVDDGMVRQGWLEDDVPILWSEWAHEGLALRSEMFAHTPGGGEVQSGEEPLFAWIRLRLHDLCHPLPLDTEHGFHLLLESLCVWATMSLRNFTVYPDFHPYSRALQVEPAIPSPLDGCRVLEPDGRVRIGIAPGSDCRRMVFTPPGEKLNCHRLFVQLPVHKDACVDVLLPMLPCDRETFDRELALGYEGARREADRFWKRNLKTATRFETPEEDVNEVLRQSVRFSLNLTEKNPGTGKYCKVNGSWVYADLWTTPMAMDLGMIMDPLGHHHTVRRYLDIFKDEQGTVVPPGAGYEKHPGYYSTPALYKSIDWLSDNGAVLWTICRHALLSGDKAFATDFADSIVKSCDWIKVNRARTGHGGYEGVLPAAVATDAQTKIQAVWSVGWNYLGLCSAVQVLNWLQHPRAVEFATEAVSYREDYVKALRDKCTSMPTWKDAKGRTRRFVPTALTGDDPSESRHGFYLDTGPLFNVFAGLLPASDPLMQDALAWFREGPQHRFYRRDSNCWQVPVLDHEMSSCEPCYSWNIFHSWQLGDREKFFEGMYSLFAGGVSQQTRISCETRGGITGSVFSASLAIYLARLAVIDEEFKPGELHLLRLTPLAWLKPGDKAVFQSVPTTLGSVTLETRVSKDGETLDVVYQAKFWVTPDKVVLHVPPMPGLNTVKVNGKKVIPKKMRVDIE